MQNISGAEHKLAEFILGTSIRRMEQEPHFVQCEESLAFNPPLGFASGFNSNGSKIRGSKIKDRKGGTFVAFPGSPVAVALDLAWFLQCAELEPNGAQPWRAHRGECRPLFGDNSLGMGTMVLHMAWRPVQRRVARARPHRRSLEQYEIRASRHRRCRRLLASMERCCDSRGLPDWTKRCEACCISEPKRSC
jgi:hypothetical protein